MNDKLETLDDMNIGDKEKKLIRKKAINWIKAMEDGDYNKFPHPLDCLSFDTPVGWDNIDISHDISGIFKVFFNITEDDLK